ncbi:hypothetical protein NM208_g10030 [Fusarium decemcellulare]|uniref:Uncharacterized protein n=1 Tax=Fusarium decemcellulare TaxID=57161 RepID=A0ACC1RZK3_9HYPO|nr:hypothetical protein NM208_g10030 [Fusarium decemcellulare]
MSGTTEHPDLEGFLQDPRFNRIFTLPADPASNRAAINVKYTDFGYRNETNPNEENVLLFFAPLMASRMLHVAKDGVAKRHKVRIISLDRPGLGGTSDVELENRIPICRGKFILDPKTQITLGLLQHLGIQHVSLACHSGGTVYALDMLLHHPGILHPDRPYIAIGAPWILPSHSHLLSMTITQAIPNVLMAQTDKFASFINTLAPALASSAGVSQTLVGLTKTGPQPTEEDSADTKFEESLDPKLFKYIHSEGIRGMSEEALILMQKLKTVEGWGDWVDYDDLVPKLAEALRRAGRRLSVDVFFAEKDSMVGDATTQGPEWLNKCWEAERETITYNSTVIPKADHDTIWSMRLGLPERVYEKISR